MKTIYVKSAALVFASVFVLLSEVHGQTPQITSLSAQSLVRSGRLRIFGSNFGTGNESQVLIGGYSAIVSRWSASQINAYVPEQVGPGSVSVQVVTPAGSSNTVQLTVTLRQRQGRVKWAFEADCDNLWFRPALAPDGTVYVHGSEGFVFALNPDGGLKWIHKANWYAYVPPAAGPEGEVYVGSIQRLTAINPDGTERWRFTDASAQGISCGPAIGPDSNLYLANDWGLGAYSLSRTGQFRWSNEGNPRLIWNGGTGAETVLGPRVSGGPIEQMYVVAGTSPSWTLQAFSLSDGSLRFSVPIGGRSNYAQQQGQPVVGPTGVIYVTHFRPSGVGWVLEAYSPTNGQSLWYYHGNTVSGMTPPDVGPDGIVYYSQDHARIVAFNPNTLSPNWTYQDGTTLYYPTVSPRNDIVVMGGVVTLGDVGFVKAINRSTGQLVWTVPLPGAPYPEPRVVAVHHPRFTPDGNTVYVSTTILGGSSSDPHAYLYALVSGDTPTDVGSSPSLPQTFRLEQNYPNPLSARGGSTSGGNPSTRIKFQVPNLKSQAVSLKIYDVLGREVATLVDGELTPGQHEVVWNAEGLPSGVYFYRLTAGPHSEIRKLTVLR